MTTKTVTLTLPPALMERAQLAATVLNHPLEEVLTDVLAATLPDLSAAPAMLRAELMQMSFLSEQQLWEIAQSMLSEAQQARLRELSEGELGRPLSTDEQQKKEALVQEYDRVLMRKARAYALLSARSGRLLLADSAQH